jgi:hypothetical protein
VALLGLLCFVVTLLARFVVGARLLLLARRTRELPELAMAIAFLAGGVVGSLLGFVAMMNYVPTDYVVAVGVVSSAGVQLSTLAIVFFNWRVFRPQARWAASFFAITCAIAIVAVLGRLVDTPEAPRGPIGFWSGMASVLLTYTWTTYEALRYYGLLRRRLHLGLADPAVAHRILLWGIAAGCTTGTSLVTLGIRVAGLQTFPPAVQLAMYALGFAAATAIWLAFFPPAIYQRRFQQRPATTTA